MNDKHKQEIHKDIEEYFEREGIVKANKIAIADFEVTSTTSNLKDVEQTINRLIGKHKDFADFRKRKRVYESSGVFG